MYGVVHWFASGVMDGFLVVYFAVVCILIYEYDLNDLEISHDCRCAKGN